MGSEANLDEVNIFKISDFRFVRPAIFNLKLRIDLPGVVFHHSIAVVLGT